MTTYTWAISYMDTKPSEDGLTDVVVSCQWSLSGTDGDYSASNFGYTKFAPPQAGDFTAYANLTQEQVLGWVWAAPAENGGVDKASAEQGIDSQIEQQMNPPTVILPNPWAQPTEA
jgi:hypothetical protein